jgi:DNA-binding NarL/FixJ family response regulator
MRVVLADDHAMILDGIRSALTAEGGFEVVGATSRGEEVLPLVGRTDPEAVVLDLRMPGMDGLTCLRRLSDRFPAVAVVICSANDDPDQIEAAFRGGARGYVLKSIRAVDFGSAIRQAVEGTACHPAGLPETSDETAAQAAGLTERETEILAAVASGLSNKAIAAELWVTPQTVKFHLTKIYRKLELNNRTEATRWAIANGLDRVRPSDRETPA